MTSENANQPPAARPLTFWMSLAALAVAILVYVWLVGGPSSLPQGTTGPAIGRQLAYLELQGLTGDAADVSHADLAGRVTLINFWGTWCPPCIREFPQITGIARNFARRDDFRLYAVSCGQGSDASLDELREPTENFLRSRGAPFAAYADQGGASRQALIGSLGSEIAYPTTLVLDRTGTIRGFWQGYHPAAGEEMTQLVEKLLDEPLPSPATAEPAG